MCCNEPEIHLRNTQGGAIRGVLLTDRLSITTRLRIGTNRPVLYEKITWEDLMHTTNLRKVGGSIMLAVAPAVQDILQLGPGGAA